MNGKKAKTIRRRIKAESGIKPSENEGLRQVYQNIKKIVRRSA